MGSCRTHLTRIKTETNQLINLQRDQTATKSTISSLTHMRYDLIIRRAFFPLLEDSCSSSNILVWIAVRNPSSQLQYTSILKEKGRLRGDLNKLF